MTAVRRLAVHLSVAVACSAMAVLAAQAPTAPVAEAARRGDAAAVRALIAQGADVNASLGDGMTALHWAADRGDDALLQVLLASGATVQVRTRIGDYTPLHLAARVGSGPAVTALLAAGAQVSARTDPGGVEPLHLAAAAGSIKAVTALLDKGASIETREAEWGQTPLIFAAASNRPEAVRTLLARGADVHAKTTALDINRFSNQNRQGLTLQRQILAASVRPGEEPTPSQWRASVEAVREFYATGVLPTPPAAAAGRGGRAGAAGEAAGPEAGRAGRAGGAAQGTGGTADAPPPNLSAKGGLNALHHAARQGYVDVVKAVLDAGAKLDEKTGDGHTPMLVAIINGQFDVAMELIARGADVNLASDSHGVTPLWAAINARWQPRTRFPQPQEMDLQQTDYLTLMKTLLDKGADVNARIRMHPWYMVYTDCGNANCGLSNMAGSTPFWRAAYGTDVDGMRLLRQYGADPNIPTMAQRTGGRGGARGGGRAGGGGGLSDDDAGGPPVPTADPSGYPVVPFGGPGVFPLHAAAGAEYGEGFAGNAHKHAPDGWLPAVKYLVEEMGADVNQRDSDGYTPLHHAAARGDNEMILYLVSKGADPLAVSRRGQTTVDMANGPVSRISPFPETIKLLEGMGAKNNHRCQSC